MKPADIIRRLIYQENELYGLYKLGETFALFERPELRDTFRLIAEEELRHRRTLEKLLEEGTLEREIIDYVDALSVEPLLADERANPESMEELVLEALLREKHAYELYSKLAEIMSGSLGDIFLNIAREELAHAYRLKLIYESI
ncbi:ferritin family protein [Thermococcus sp.]|jgi:rubrerythrin|uniref:ferritin family protein n=1 Tax=Thermococcus sp. TaxID=35749 RepID=UPI002614BC12|nr:ferritin family protein [Thermococcus sp.]